MGWGRRGRSANHIGIWTEGRQGKKNGSPLHEYPVVHGHVGLHLVDLQDLRGMCCLFYPEKILHGHVRGTKTVFT